MPKTPTKRQKATPTNTPSPYRRTPKKAAPSQAALPSPIRPTSSPNEYRFDFGKHRGKTLQEAGSWYVNFCIKNEIARNRPALAAAIEQWKTISQEGGVYIISKEDLSHVQKALEMRRQRILRKIPQWLYMECVFALNPDFSKEDCEEVEDIDLDLLGDNDGWRRMEEMSDSDFPQDYPPRPDSSLDLPNSKSVRAFQRVLSAFPECRHKNGQCLGVTKGEEHVRVAYDGQELVEWYVLTNDYEEALKRRLRAVEREHGDELAAIARWQVRDKYAQNVQGIAWCDNHYYPSGFADNPAHWLKPQL